MPRQDAQQQFEEQLIEDAELFEALKTLERFKAVRKQEQAPVQKAREKAQDKIDVARERMGVEAAEEVVAAREAAFLARYKPGQAVRVGDFRWEIESYATMERVETGQGVRMRKPKRVQGEMEPLLA